MIKKELIYEWGKWESLRRDKIASIIIVSGFTILLLSTFKIRIPKQKKENVVSATVIHLDHETISKEWLMKAEEGGPFPGGISVQNEHDLLNPESLGISKLWKPSQGQLKPLEPIQTKSQNKTLSIQELPRFSDSDTIELPPQNVAFRQIPTLKVYDPKALAWLPRELPKLDIPESKEPQQNLLRFMLNLRENGSVADVISMSSGTDAIQESIESWLASLAFQKAEETRWLVIDVEFIKQTYDGSKPQ